MCFAVGDEDPTSTGVNWARVIDGAIWRGSGVVPSGSSFGSPSAHTFAWMCGENARHGGNVAPVTNPYNPQVTEYISPNVALDFWPHAIAQRAAELNQTATVPVPALSHTPRNSAQQFRGLDDPQEWWVGRQGEPLPAALPTDPLILDTGFRDAVNPGATGNMPGGRESMFISNGLVYVGSADGFVSSFFVDTGPKYPLVRYAQSPCLGHECHAIAKVPDGGDWTVVAGTRRHLHKLDKDTLQVIAQVSLPYEVAQPHHIVCADVLPGHAGAEIVFATLHGGLCFYDLHLQPIFEWPEPGIVDFFAADGKITLLSSRGVVATVSFDANRVATLEAVSKAIPQQFLQHGALPDPSCQGRPFDLERMLGNYGGIVPVTISSWTGDEDGECVRLHVPAFGLAGDALAPNLGSAVVDIATCKESTTGGGGLGDHALILLANGRLLLRDQLGAPVGEKNLTLHADPNGLNGASYYPFGAQAHTMAVGELVTNSGSPGYNQEIVIATNTGLMWLHVEELAASGTVLPANGSSSGAHVSGFWVEKNGPTMTPQPPPLAATHVQPRTNQALQSTWAMSRRPATGGLDPYLHVLDQRGVYWRVGHGGQVQLWERDALAVRSRGWDHVGTLSPTSPALMPNNLLVAALGQHQAIVARSVFCPIATEDTVAELTNHYFPDNWHPRSLGRLSLDGFYVHPVGGTVLQKPNGWMSGTGGGFEIWHWTFAPGERLTIGGVPKDVGQWGNLVQGLHVKTPGEIDGLWASTATSIDQCPHHRLRSFNGATASINQQAIAAVDLGGATNLTAVILGCPGGRIRVCIPAAMRMSDAAAHDIGNLASTPGDFGLGVSALAVRPESNGTVRIWFGTIAHPDRRPAGYTQATGSLGDSEVSAGALHQVVWTPGTSQQFSAVSTTPLHPTSAEPRGASAVVGMALGDLLPDAGDELVVGTLSGDLIFFSADSMAELWRTHVHGAAGCYNALRIADLDNDGHKELYVAGSSGLWRFVRPGEQ